MRYQDIRNKISELEEYVQADPDKYRSNLLIICVAGYLFIGLILIALIAFVIYSFTGKEPMGIGIVVSVVLGINFLSCLRLKFELPQGVIMSPEALPKLHAFIEAIRQKLEAPRVSKLIISNDINAGIFQKPVGFFFNRNYMIIGIPILGSFSNQELTAIIGHELYHLKGNDCSLLNRMLRLRNLWNTFIPTVVLSLIPGPFKNFQVKLEAYLYVTGKSNEDFADHKAAEISGKETMGNALLKLSVMNYLAEKVIWKKYQLKAKDMEVPDVGPMDFFLEAIKQPIDEAEKADILSKVMAVNLDIEDEHMPLKTRLRAFLKGKPEFPSFQNENTMELLGDQKESLIASVDSTLLLHPQWITTCRVLKESSDKLNALNSKASEAPLSQAELIEQACLYSTLYESEKALSIYREIYQEDKNNAFVLAEIGRILLEKEDESGVAFLQESMRKNGIMIPINTEIIANYLKEHGRVGELEKYYQFRDNNYDKFNTAAKEIYQFTASNTYLPHNMSQSSVKQINMAIRKTRSARKAYLVRKQVDSLQGMDIYLLAVEESFISFRFSEPAEQRIIKALDSPYNINVIRLGRFDGRFKKNLKTIKNSRIYPPNKKISD